MMFPRREDERRIAFWQAILALWLVFSVVCLVVLLNMATAQAMGLTFTKAQTCKVATVSRRGNDIILRCDGKDFTIQNQPLSCPAFSYIRDASGNLVVRC